MQNVKNDSRAVLEGFWFREHLFFLSRGVYNKLGQEPDIRSILIFDRIMDIEIVRPDKSINS